MNHWAFVVLVILHVFVCVLLILLILIQNDKGGGLAGAFGGMGGGAAFTGSSAATFITKLTQGAALISFLLLLGLNYLSTRGIESGRQESELKAGRRGLSSVLPSAALPIEGSIKTPVAVPGVAKDVPTTQGAPALEPASQGQ